MKAAAAPGRDAVVMDTRPVMANRPTHGLPPGSVLADTQRAKESPGHTGAFKEKLMRISTEQGAPPGAREFAKRRPHNIARHIAHTMIVPEPPTFAHCKH